MAVVIKGLVEAQTAIRRFAEEASKLENVNRDLGQKIASRATATAPRLTGQLAASIDYKEIEGGVQVYAGSETVPYAGVTEYGWPQRGRSAKPFLMPAAKQYTGQIVQTYENGIQQLIGKYNLQ